MTNLEFLNGKTAKELNILMQDIMTIKNGRAKNLKKALEISEVDYFFELLHLVDLNSQDLWNELFSVNLEKITHEMFDRLFNEHYKLPRVVGTVFSGKMELKKIIGINKETEHTLFDPIFAIKEIVKHRLELHLKYNEFSLETFEVACKILGKEKMMGISKNFLENFGKSLDISTGYESVHKFVIQNDLISQLFNGISKEENLEYFLSVPEYKKYFNEAMKQEDQILLMTNSIKKADHAKIKVLYEMGVPFPKEKQPYSDLFLKTKEEFFEAQMFVINKIEDITFGNQIILKTLLHSKYSVVTSNHLQLVQKTVERYLDEQADLLLKATEKREDSKEVLFVKKFYEYKKLSFNVSEREKEKGIKLKI